MVKNVYVLDKTGPYCWKCEETISCQGIHPVKVTKRPTFRLTRDRQPATELLCGAPRHYSVAVYAHGSPLQTSAAVRLKQRLIHPNP